MRVKRSGFVFQGRNPGSESVSEGLASGTIPGTGRRKGIVAPLRDQMGWSEGGNIEESQATAAAE